MTCFLCSNIYFAFPLRAVPNEITSPFMYSQEPRVLDCFRNKTSGCFVVTVIKNAADFAQIFQTWETTSNKSLKCKFIMSSQEAETWRQNVSLMQLGRLVLLDFVVYF